jgi:DNA-binding NtrC family response regulator
MQNVISVAIVDPEPRMIEEAVQAIVAYRPQIAIYPSISLMLESSAETTDVIILNLERPFEETFELIPQLKAKLPSAEIVFITRFHEESLWVEAIQRGAYDLLPKPIDVSELERILLHATEKHRGELQPQQKSKAFMRNWQVLLICLGL